MIRCDHCGRFHMMTCPRIKRVVWKWNEAGQIIGMAEVEYHDLGYNSDFGQLLNGYYGEKEMTLYAPAAPQGSDNQHAVEGPSEPDSADDDSRFQGLD